MLNNYSQNKHKSIKESSLVREKSTSKQHKKNES